MEPFKNEFSHHNARRIAGCIRRADPGFSVSRFCRGLEAELEPLELKQRMRVLADRIEAGLPQDPRLLFPILMRSLGEDAESGLSGFLVWPLTEVVARRGLEDFDGAMKALEQMTRRFTAEFAIRPFLRAEPGRTLKQLGRWCSHPDEHVRRLVSEGSRPLLPWGGNLPELLEPPHPTLRLLDKLHRDPSDYVRLSVANHLNDFSKHHPDLVIQTLGRWRGSASGDERLDKLARHACRTLLKQGHEGAMVFLGYGPAKALVVEEFELAERSIALGESIGYRLLIRNRSRHRIRVMFDYAIHHRKAGGGLSPKVFKGRTKELGAGEGWEITGRHAIRKITTRVYYPGGHRFEPRINGRAFPALDFMLET